MYVCVYVCIYVCTYVCMALFTPLTVPTEGVLHVEYAAYLKQLASKLATKWQCSYSVVMNSVKNQLCHHQGSGPPTDGPGQESPVPPPGWFRPWGSLVLI